MKTLAFEKGSVKENIQGVLLIFGRFLEGLGKLCYDAIGNKNEALKYSELSSKLTDTDDHDFLTKAQE